MKQKNLVYTIASVVGMVAILGFQNCSQGVSFQQAVPVASAASQISAPTCSSPKVSVADSCVCPAGSNDNGVTCLTCTGTQIFDAPSLSCVAPPVVCQPGYDYDGHACVAISATCNSFVEIKSSNFVVPARVTDKVCYYIKLVNATTVRSSVTLDYVLSRNHDGGPRNRAPSIIGQKNISFLMQGDREVVLSGDTHGGASISVDNYILIEALFDGLANEKLWASGTGDVPPLDANGNPYPIQVHGQPVINFYPYSAAGTATFQAIDLAPILTVKKQIDFIASALDCGGGTNSSDAYLLFR